MEGNAPIIDLAIEMICTGAAPLDTEALFILLRDESTRHHFLVRMHDFILNNGRSPYLELNSSPRHKTLTSNIELNTSRMLISIAEDIVTSEDILGLQYFLKLVNAMRLTEVADHSYPHYFQIERGNLTTVLIGKFLACNVVNDIQILRNNLRCIVPDGFLCDASSFPLLSTILSYMRCCSLFDSLSSIIPSDTHLLQHLIQKIYHNFEINNEIAHGLLLPMFSIHLLSMILQIYRRISSLYIIAHIINFVNQQCTENDAFSVGSARIGLLTTPGFSPFIELVWSALYLNDLMNEDSHKNKHDTSDSICGLSYKYCFACRRQSFSPWKFMERGQDLHSTHDEFFGKLPTIICEHCMRLLLGSLQAGMQFEVGLIVLPQNVKQISLRSRLDEELFDGLAAQLPKEIMHSSLPILESYFREDIQLIQSRLSLGSGVPSRLRSISETSLVSAVETLLSRGLPVTFLVDKKEIPRLLYFKYDSGISMDGTYQTLKDKAFLVWTNLGEHIDQNSDATSAQNLVVTESSKSMKLSHIRQIKVGSGKFSQCLSLISSNKTIAIRIEEASKFKILKNGLLEIVSILSKSEGVLV